MGTFGYVSYDGGVLCSLWPQTQQIALCAGGLLLLEGFSTSCGVLFFMWCFGVYGIKETKLLLEERLM
jgi:hypothetical protein